MDSTLITKIAAGSMGLVCIMVLALTGHIDGPTAAVSVQTITGVFLGSTAVLGSARAVASAMKKPS